MFDAKKETVINFSQAARRVPGGVHRATIARWAERGVLGIRLEFERVGGRKITTVEALERFLAACRDRRGVGLENAGVCEQALAAKEQLDACRGQR